MENSFESVARAWPGNWKSDKTDRHAAQVLRRLEAHVLPAIGMRPVSAVTARELLEISVSEWKQLHDALSAKLLLNPKGIGVLNVAMQIPLKVPTEKPCAVLLETLEKGRLEGHHIEVKDLGT